MCGSAAGDLDECDGTILSLSIEISVLSDSDPTPDIKVICSCCSQGLRGILMLKPDRLHLLSQIRRATIDDQEAVLKWLLQKFGMVGEKKR